MDDHMPFGDEGDKSGAMTMSRMLEVSKTVLKPNGVLIFRVSEVDGEYPFGFEDFNEFGKHLEENGFDAAGVPDKRGEFERDGKIVTYQDVIFLGRKKSS